VEVKKTGGYIMNMDRTKGRLPAIIAVFGMLLLVATAAAKGSHHDAKHLLGDNVKNDGHHEIDHKGKYTTSVEVKNGKVAGMHVKHSEKGDIPVKKYKTHNKMAKAADGHIVYASFTSAQDQDLGTVYIGYSYVDDNGDEEIYWFPEEMILDGDTGAVEYVPTS
jgi:hypothetical protein